MDKTGFDFLVVQYGGGIVEAFSMIFLYIFKHLFDMEIPFKEYLDRLRDREYREASGFVTLFVKAQKQR